MTQWGYLVLAVLAEVAGTLSLKAAADGERRHYLTVVIGYVLAFSLLALSLHSGMALGVAYGIWAAAGVALTAVASKFLFSEPLTAVMGAGILLVMIGVLLVELAAGR